MYTVKIPHVQIPGYSLQLHESPQNREISSLVITVDVGDLVNWRFNDMSTMTRWAMNLVDSHVEKTSLKLTKPFIQVTSDSLDGIKYEAAAGGGG